MTGIEQENNSTDFMTLEERRERIYAELRELTPWLMRRECTPRNLQPIDVLLDQLIEIGYEEDLLLDEEEVGYGL